MNNHPTVFDEIFQYAENVSIEEIDLKDLEMIAGGAGNDSYADCHSQDLR